MASREFFSSEDGIYKVEIGLKLSDDCCSYIMCSINSATLKTIVVPIVGGTLILPTIYDELPISVIEMGTFRNLCHVESVIVGDRVTMLDLQCFQVCTSIKSITIPANLKFVCNNAFFYCDNLETINYLGTISQWNSIKKSKVKNIYELFGHKLKVMHCLDGDITP